MRVRKLFGARPITLLASVIACAYGSSVGCAPLSQECTSAEDCARSDHEDYICAWSLCLPSSEILGIGEVQQIDAWRGIEKRFALFPNEPTLQGSITLVNAHERLQLEQGIVRWTPTSDDLGADLLALELWDEVRQEALALEISVSVRERRITKVAAGDWHSCALLEDGKVRCFGFAQGETSDLVPGTAKAAALGHGGTTSTRYPYPAGYFGDLTLDGPASDVCVGSAHSCAVIDGNAHCWGMNDWGQLGVPSTQTSHISSSGGAHITRLEAPLQSIHCGSQNTCAFLENGELWCWGRQWKSASLEELGVEPQANGCNPAMPDGPREFGPTRARVSNITEVQMAGERLCIRDALHDFRCWGSSCFTNAGAHNQQDPDDPDHLNFSSPGNARERLLRLGTRMGCVLEGIHLDCSGDGFAPIFERRDIDYNYYASTRKTFVFDFAPYDFSVSTHLICAWNDSYFRCIGHDDAEWTRPFNESWSQEDLKFYRPPEEIPEGWQLIGVTRGALLAIDAAGALQARVVQAFDELAPAVGVHGATFGMEWAEAEVLNFRPRVVNVPARITPSTRFFWPLEFPDDGDRVRVEDVMFRDWLSFNGVAIEGDVPANPGLWVSIDLMLTDGRSLEAQTVEIPSE